MKPNFYYLTFLEDYLLPFIREGIPITIEEGSMFINGLGKYKLFKDIIDVKDEDVIEDKFSDYSINTPWIGKESNNVNYLYRTSINESDLNLESNEDEVKYLYLDLTAKDMVSVLNGKIFFRFFDKDKQNTLVKFNEGTILHIEKEEGLIIIELVNGEFICR
jgi:hypothetical protein